ncbi:alpha-L-rhamnosidase-related protein [Enterococcus sp. LJL120]
MIMEKTQVRWLWYPGDFEIRQGLLQNFSREERGFDWPAYWYQEDCHRNVKFKRYYDLKESTEFIVHGIGIGYVEINGEKFPLETKLICPAGKNKIRIFIGNLNELPTIYIEGEVVKSDAGWQASNFIQELPAGWSEMFHSKNQNPNEIVYTEMECDWQEKTEVKGGTLFDFGRAVFGTHRFTKLVSKTPVTICYGESEAEALDVDMCYYKENNAIETTVPRKRAFRYLFIPEVVPENVDIIAYHQYLPIIKKAQFTSNSSLVNKIWQVSEETFKFCSDLFFIDGIKRDRWIWSGDAYQSYLINQYLFFDEDINKRTMLALRGQNEIKQHMNTIVDYSILWLIGIENHYMMTGDAEFLSQVYEKMLTMMNYLEKQTNELGFIYGREKDWIFIDWSEMDKEGTLAAEQVLLLKAYQSMAHCGAVLGKKVSHYEEAFDKLKKNLMEYFWDAELGSFIDSYESGNRHVTRHANIFAVLFDFLTEKEEASVLNNVLLNDDITQITTPYFKFFEQDALCKLGETKTVFAIIQEYWGGMLKRGAVTFWEEFNPNELGDDAYAMYGDPFGKSLCHAWGASPIYLLGRHFAGLKPTSPGYESFEIAPNLTEFDEVSFTLPVKNGQVTIEKKGDEIVIFATRDGGTVVFNQQNYTLTQNEPLKLLQAQVVL